MRKLITRDLFAFSRMVRKLGVKDEIKKILDECSSIADVYSKGYEMIYSLFEFATTENAEKELYRFFAPIFEIDEKDFETMELDELINGISEMVKNNNLTVFFKQASALMK